MIRYTEGQTVGEWTVIKYEGKIKHRDRYLCRCVCGKEVSVQARTLTNGDSTSCGCMKAKNKHMDITGSKYGRLTVIRKDGTERNRTMWLCRCDCGKLFRCIGKNLVNGNTKSCGCINHGKGQIRKNIKGRTFGWLTAESYLGVVDGRSVWRCKCACGKTHDVQTYSLLSGIVKSCGCRHYKETDTYELAARFKKHPSTVVKAKKELFGALYVLNDREIKRLQEYFDARQRTPERSKGEIELCNFVASSCHFDVMVNDRELIAPKELDIYVPEKNLAVEFDGLYWHSEATGCTQGYHLSKTKACQEKGIRLIHIYDSEWRDKKDIVKSMIRSALGIYSRKIPARKCTVREVTDRQVVRDFFDSNHIQGAVYRHSLCLGLYYAGELVQACVFGKQHFGRDGSTELYRMVTLKDTQVLGGFSRLMSHCPYDSVVSYVSRRLFDASGYYAGGWVCDGTSAPSFCITDGVNTFSRHLFKKAAMLSRYDDLSEGMTEREMQVRHGFYRLWDCGTFRVRWNRQKA